MATVRKRGNSYQIRSSCGYDVTGKQIVRQMTWKPDPKMTQKQIEKELERQKVLFDEKCKNGLYLDGTIKLADFADKWFKDYAEKQLKVKTISSYKEQIKRINQGIGHIPLSKLQPHHLMELYNNLAEDGIREDIKYTPCADFRQIIKQLGYTQKALADRCGVSVSVIKSCVDGRNITQDSADKISNVINQSGLFTQAPAKNRLSNRTISYCHSIISSILSTAVHWQVIPFNPCDRVKPPKVERKEKEILTGSELARFLSLLDTQPLQYKTMVTVALYAGLRRGELVALNWSDVDFGNSAINISKGIVYTPDTGIVETTPKNKSSERIVSLPAHVMDLLKEYQKHYIEKRLLMGDLWENTDKVFISQTGGVMNPDTFSGWFNKFVKRNDFNISVHTLRHINASLMLAGNVDLKTVSSRLGHAETSTTLNIYSHLLRTAEQQTPNKIDNAISIQIHKQAN